MVINNRDRQRTRTVFVPVGGGGSKIETSELSVSENGTYEAGKDKAYSKVTVKVTEPLRTVKIADYGVKLSDSTFTSLPEWVDTKGMTDMSKMFSSCESLTTIPLIDTSGVTDMNYMFAYCYSLTTIPLIDTSSVTNMDSMFYWCSKLTTIPQLDTSSVTNMELMFYWCSKLTDMGGFIGLKCNLNLSSCTNLTHDSILNVINKAADVTASPATLTLGSSNLAKLTDEEKAVATAKGWTLA